MRPYFAFALTSALLGACSSAKNAPDAGLGDGGGPAGPAHVYVVAHEDDDLLFTNPDLKRSIEGGHAVRVVYTTSAGTSDPVAWRAREHGAFTPLMMMAKAVFDPIVDSATYWTCGPHTFAGAQAQLCTLTQNPRVAVIYLRVHDGALSTLWATDNGPPFFATPVPTLTSVDGLNTYTKAGLVDVIAAIFAENKPERVGMLDSTFAYGDDHADHHAAGLFALEALHQWGGVTQARIYRGYTMDGAPTYYLKPEAEPVNLSAEEYTEKHAIMYAYAGGFPDGSTYDNWCHRQYVISRIAKGVGPVAGAAGGCLDAKDGVAADGVPVVVTPCTGAAAQRWSLTPDYQIQGPGGKCVAIGSTGAIELATCAVNATQKWSLFANGQVRGQNGACLTDNGDGTLGAKLCVFEFTTVGKRRQPKATQRFTQLASPALAWSNGADFSDVQVGASPASYRSFQLSDLDGDGYADACVRLGAGVQCAINGHTVLGASTLFGAAFADASGWSNEAYGATVQYADVDGDKRPDACARNASGIMCALGNGTGFAAPTAWSAELTDATTVVRFGDLNGDGFADVCGRSATGVACALNTKAGGFAAATPWITTEFTDAAGWSADACASTVQLADVDGDGKADVCGRGPAGLTCATSTGANTFVHAHLWSFREDFSDLAGWSAAAGYFGSIHFGDVDGDGLADVCGRNANGVVCARSSGTAFEHALAVQPNVFTDPQGWLPDPYGMSLRIADVDHDGRADLCGRSPAGLTCSTMP